jgi:hypothetical protein
MELVSDRDRMMDAEDHLLYASDYPHTAARPFKLPRRNEKQRVNLFKYGNLTA